MPVTRERKSELVSELTEELKQAQAVIITDYRSLKVADLQGIRNELRGMKTAYHIAKNTLLEIALKDGVTDYSFVPVKLLQAGYRLTMLKEEEVNLETAFMRLTKGIVQ